MTVTSSMSNTLKATGTKCLLQFVSSAWRELSKKLDAPYDRVRQNLGEGQKPESACSHARC